MFQQFRAEEKLPAGYFFIIDDSSYDSRNKGLSGLPPQK